MTDGMQKIKKESEIMQGHNLINVNDGVQQNGSVSPENEGINGCLGREETTKGKTKKKKCSFLKYLGQEVPQPHTKIDYEAALI